MKNIIIKMTLTLMGFEWQEKHCFRNKETNHAYWCHGINLRTVPEGYEYIGKGVIAEKIT